MEEGRGMGDEDEMGLSERMGLNRAVVKEGASEF